MTAVPVLPSVNFITNPCHIQREDKAFREKRADLHSEFTTMGHRILSVSVDRSDTNVTFGIVTR